MRKIEAVMNLRRGAASIAWPVEATCSSCHAPWAATNQSSMDAFYFIIPGGLKVFVCPICRHMASYVVHVKSFAEMREERNAGQPV